MYCVYHKVCDTRVPYNDSSTAIFPVTEHHSLVACNSVVMACDSVDDNNMCISVSQQDCNSRGSQVIILCYYEPRETGVIIYNA